MVPFYPCTNVYLLYYITPIKYKLTTGTQKGIELAQKVGRTYNKFAQWLAIPPAPEFITNLEAKQIQRVEQKTYIITNTNVNLSTDLPLIQLEFDKLKDELENLNSKIDSDLEKIQDSLDELSTNSDNRELAKPFNKLYRLLDKLSDPNSDYNKVIIGTQKGIELAQKVGRTYNKFAQWLSMPQVPDLFLGKS
jgi:internalin A